MEFLYRDKLPNPAVINERIRQFNHIIHGVSQWREPPLDTQWPILVKDNIDVSGLRATAGSYALKELKAEDAFCIKKLREHGGFPFGKASMSELAGFLSTKMPPGYSELGGQGINPIDPSLTTSKTLTINVYRMVYPQITDWWLTTDGLFTEDEAQTASPKIRSVNSTKRTLKTSALSSSTFLG